MDKIINEYAGEPDISADGAKEPGFPRPQGRYAYVPVVRVKFDNPSKVKFLPEFAGSPEHDVSFAIFDGDGCDTGYVGTLLPGSLASTHYFVVDRYPVVKNNVEWGFTEDEGLPTDGYISTMYVSRGVCANSRIVAGLLEFCYPNRRAYADFRKIDRALAAGEEILLPSLEEAEAIIGKGIEGLPFDNFDEMRHVLNQAPRDVSTYGDEWLGRHFSFPAEWQP